MRVLNMRRVFPEFLKDHSAATAIEYALIASLIACSLIGGARALGGSINNTFSWVAGTLTQ